MREAGAGHNDLDTARAIVAWSLLALLAWLTVLYLWIG